MNASELTNADNKDCVNAGIPVSMPSTKRNIGLHNNFRVMCGTHIQRQIELMESFNDDIRQWFSWLLNEGLETTADVRVPSATFAAYLLKVFNQLLLKLWLRFDTFHRTNYHSKSVKQQYIRRFGGP